MTLASFPIRQFGGLNLVEPDKVAADEAIDLLNIDFDRVGAIRARDGYSKFNSVAAGSSVRALYQWSNAGSTQIIAFTNPGLSAYSGSGVLISSVVPATGPEPSRRTVATLGTGTAGPYLYIAIPPNSLERWDGAAWTNVASAGNIGQSLAVQPTDNRLVTANMGGSSTSRVRFSDAGAPETFGANNFVDLHPNDGQNVGGLIAWRDYLFAFKETKFFVFYGNSTDGQGNPIFNYRTVDTGVGLFFFSNLGQPACVAAPEGLYFVSRTGIYVTTGGPPQKISGQLDPLFSDTATVDGFFGIRAPVQARELTYSRGRLFFTFTSGTGSTYYLLVYYVDRGVWALWQMGVNAWSFTHALLTGNRTASTLFCGDNVDGFIYKLDSTTTTDNGTAIPSHYRSGFYSPIGNPSQECVVRESLIDGQGTPTYSVSKDYGAVPDTGGGAKASVTLGVANLIPNPGFEIDTSGWQLGPGGIGHASAATSLTRVTTVAAYGSASLQVVNPATANVGIETTPAFTTTFASGTTYSIRFDAYSAAGAGALRARIIAIGSLDSAQVDFTPTSTWQTFSFQWTPSGDRSDVFLQFYTPGGTAGTWNLDAVMGVQSGTVPSRFFDGSQGYAQGRHRKSQKGRLFSWQLEASSGAWQANSIVQMVRSKRPPGIKST